MAFPVLSTYRLQMRGRLLHLRRRPEACWTTSTTLGVSHLYLSPILTAVEGSTHGYDVTDPTTVSAALGGPEGLARLSAAAQARGMGLIVDIVPNHVGVDKPEQNRWWRDVLEHGRNSPYASYFDIDWDLDPDGRIVLPVLGSDDDTAPPGYPADDTHYRLIGWRNGICGYRRFFSITSLAGLRQEDRAVFDATHVEVKRWFGEGLVDGIRIDHPDGLSNPAGYLTWLRELAGPDAWIVIEKILAVDEPLEPTLPVAGTTGYDALREIGGLFIDPAGAGPLTALFESDRCRLRRDAAAGPSAQGRCRHRHAGQRAGAAAPHHRRRHGRRSSATCPRPSPRCSAAYTCTAPTTCRCPSVLPEAHGRNRLRRDRNWREPLAIVAAALARSAEAADALQQLCGAATAKSMEDCLFYRDATAGVAERGGRRARTGSG